MHFIGQKLYPTFIPIQGACASACANFGKIARTRACAVAIKILAKRTRACDVRAAKIRVCECACVRGKKSSQLTVC